MLVRTVGVIAEIGNKQTNKHTTLTFLNVVSSRYIAFVLETWIYLAQVRKWIPISRINISVLRARSQGVLLQMQMTTCFGSPTFAGFINIYKHSSLSGCYM